MGAMDTISRIAVAISLALVVGALGALPGCATTKRSDSEKAWDRAQCDQIISDSERKRCLERVEHE